MSKGYKAGREAADVVAGFTGGILGNAKGWLKKKNPFSSEIDWEKYGVTPEEQEAERQRRASMTQEERDAEDAQRKAELDAWMESGEGKDILEKLFGFGKRK